MAEVDEEVDEEFDGNKEKVEEGERKIGEGKRGRERQRGCERERG